MADLKASFEKAVADSKKLPEKLLDIDKVFSSEDLAMVQASHPDTVS